MRKLKLILEYRGDDFVGWQRQKTGCSVQEAVELALFRLTQQQISVRAAGRTDAGVHALGQVLSLETKSSLPLHVWVDGCNAYLPRSIAVMSAEEMAEDFDARHSASGKLYRYQIWNSRARSALLEKTHYHVRSPLSLDLMKEAADVLCGRHDFASFRAADCQRKTTVRLVRKVEILEIPQAFGSQILIEVEGTAFLKNMVRILAGTLIQVGLCKMTVSHVKTLLHVLDRTQAGPTAPSHGLFLCRVDYNKREGV